MSAHEDMLMQHINDLYGRGESAEAEKVIKILNKHRDHQMMREKDDTKGLVLHLEEKAATEHCPPNASGGGGTYLMGWPIEELVKTIEPSKRAAVRAELIRRNASMVRGIGAAKIGGSYFPPAQPAPPAPPAALAALAALAAHRGFTNDEMLCMRMRWPTPQVNGWHTGFAHVASHSIGDKVHVWVITKDAQSVVLEDDANLFPSDALITKLNLMK